MGMRPYVIRQGDYLSKLAHRMDFDARFVWEHPRNRELKESRASGEVLHPGDILYLPEPDEESGRLPITAGATNKYKATIPKVPIHIVLRDEEGPLAGKSYRILGMGKPHRGTTDGDGAVTFSVPVHIREVRLVMDETGEEYPIMIGDMDPVEEHSGIWKRLEHMGYLSRLDIGPDGAAPAALRRAIESFQAANGIEVTGALDEATREALVKHHGS
jgi:hypothetical protein